MQVIPAIDIMGGQVVRLRRGVFADATIYDSDPVKVARAFVDGGASLLHLVDLDGARLGRPCQLEVIAKIKDAVGVDIQMGGGLRDFAAVQAAKAKGVSRLVLGSAAVRDPDLARNALREYGPESVVMALDLDWSTEQQSLALVDGWTTQSGSCAFTLAASLLADGLKYVLSTDISRDGLLTGPALGLYQAWRRRLPSLSLIASGGVSTPADISALAALGCQGVVVGKAIYEGKISIKGGTPSC